MSLCPQQIYLRLVPDGSGGAKWQHSSDDGNTDPYADATNNDSINLTYTELTDAQTKNLTFTTNTNWFSVFRVVLSRDYLIVGYKDVIENKTGAQVSGTITVSHPNASQSQTFTLYQKPTQFTTITASPTSLAIAQGGGSASTSIDADQAWTLTHISGSDVFSKSATTGVAGVTSVTFSTFDPNVLGSPISATYRFTLDGTGIFVDVTVTQAA